MAATLNGNGIVFGDGTTQNTAALNNVRDFGGVGSYAVLMRVTNNNLGAEGSTVAGSELRYNWPTTDTFTSHTRNGANAYAAGGTALSGTWRKMSAGPTYYLFPIDKSQGYGWAPHLYVRIA